MHLLPLLLLRRVGVVLVLLDDGHVRLDHVVQRVLGKRKQRLGVAVVEVVEEDAAQPAALAAVLDLKVLVAPGLEARVESLVVAVAHSLHGEEGGGHGQEGHTRP
jgi:hypothetical protein